MTMLRPGTTFAFPLRGSLILSASVLAGMTIASGSASAQELEFKFKVPNTLTYVQTEKATRTIDKAWYGKDIETRTIRERVTMRKTANGYTVTNTLISHSQTKNGEIVKNPIFMALWNTPITYIIDDDGRLVNVKGAEKVRQKLQASLSEDLTDADAKEAAQELALMSITEGVSADWNDSIARFNGRKANVGDVWLAVDRYLGDEGLDTYYTATQFVRQEKCADGKECVRLRLTGNSDLGTLKSQVKASGGSTMELGNLSETKPEHPDVIVTSSRERLVDPSSLLTYSETQTQAIQQDITLPEEGKIHVTATTKLVTTFDYHPQPVKSSPKKSTRRVRTAKSAR